MTRYWVEHGVEVLGPLSAEEIASRLAEGSLSRADAYWDGNRWELLGALLDGRSPLASLAAWCATVSVGVGLSLSVAAQVVFRLSEGWPDNLHTLASYLGITACLGAVAYFAARKAFARGGAKLVQWIVGFVILHQAMALGYAYRLVEGMREGFGSASMEWRTSSELVIAGGIGLGFHRQLQVELSKAAGPVLIHLSSHGGSVDEALRASDYMRQRGSVTVRVTEACMSACVALLAGVQTQALPWSAIGVHKPSSIFGDHVDAQADDYIAKLRDAGFAEAVITAARETPATDMKVFDPIIDRKLMPRFRLVDERGFDRSYPSAALLRIARQMESDQSESAEMFRALADYFPEAAEGVEADLVRGLVADDQQVLMGPLTQVLQRGTQLALRRASGASIRAFERVLAKSVVPSADGKSCLLSAAGSREIKAVRERLILSAAKNEARMEKSSVDDKRYEAFVARATAHPYVQSLNLTDPATLETPEAHCAFEVAFEAALEEVTDAEIPAIVERWLSE